MNYKLQITINKIGTWYHGIRDIFYDIWYNLKYGIINLYRFFWVVWKWRAHCNTYSMNLYANGLIEYLKRSNKYEVDEDRIPKELDIQRAIDIIDNIENSNYISAAEVELGLKHPTRDILFEKFEDDSDMGDDLYELIDTRTDEDVKIANMIYMLSDKIEQDEWDELISLIRNNARSWWN